MNMNENELTRLAYLVSMEKKPLDILLEIIEVDCYKYNFSKLGIIGDNKESIHDIILDAYGIDIPKYILNYWVKHNFEIENNKLVLKGDTNIAQKVAEVKHKEEEYLKSLKVIRKDFIKFALERYNKHFDNTQTKEIFDKYFYAATRSSNLNVDNDNLGYAILNKFLTYLYDTDLDALDILENFGVANQIQDITINPAKLDEKFLDGCIVYLDTPILMKRLGYDGYSLFETYIDFLKSLKDAGASFRVFEHTFDELYGILFNFELRIAQGFISAKGVDTYLLARKEFCNKEGNTLDDDTLSLDKDIVKKNVKELISSNDRNDDETETEFDPAYNEEDIDNHEIWFDESKYRNILLDYNESLQQYDNRVNNDVKSVSAIFIRRAKDGIKSKDTKTYKRAKYFLLVDNYALVKATKKYHEEKSECPHYNELMLENTVLFDLWQSSSDKKSLNKAMFRSKCLALNVINKDFKTTLVDTIRRLEIYHPESNAEENIIANPDIINDVYMHCDEDEFKNEEYIKKVYNNVVEERENAQKIKYQQKDEECKQLSEKITTDSESATKIIEQKDAEIKQLNNDRYNNVKTRYNEYANNILCKAYCSFRKFFDKTFSKEEYLAKKACKSLLIDYDWYKAFSNNTLPLS